MPAKKKPTVASRLRGFGAKVKAAKAAKPGAYQTHEGGVILNVHDDLLSRGIGHAFDSTEKALSSKKAPQRGKQAYGNRNNKNSQKRK
jgi:hypothetical protein